MNISTIFAAAAIAVAPFTAFAAETGDLFSNYVTNPKENEDLTSFSGMYHIGFPDSSEIDDNYNGVTLKNTTTGTTYKAMMSMASDVAGRNNNGVYYIFSFSAVTEKGAYEVAYPAGAFTIDGEKSPAFSTHFSIGMPQQGGEDPVTPPVDPSENPLTVWTVTPDPEQTQLELPEVEVEFPDLGKDYIFGPMTGVEMSLVDAQDRDFRISIGTNYKKFTVGVEENLFNGTYTLTLGEGLFVWMPEDYDDDVELPDCPSPLIKLTYVIDNGSVVMAVENADSYNVIGLDGQVVLSDAPASALESLPAGLYVINGKKTVVRR